MGSEDRIVENIRSVAEILVYGDQHTEQLFDYFCEKNILALFIGILEETHCSNAIKIQIIQTVSIIAQNIRSEISLYYILSNNHVNRLITHPFNFADEEVVAFYISFLKTLSLKLNPETIQLFFNDRLNTLPLYEEAIKFFEHPEGMVRTAVRTITLNVYRIDDPIMRTFVTQGPPARYFEDVVRNIHHSCRLLYLQTIRFEQVAEAAVERKNSVEATQNVRSTLLKLEVGMTELQDHFVYIEDILALKFKDIEVVTIDAVTAYLFWPLVISSLLPSSQPFNQLEDMAVEELHSLGIQPESLQRASTSNPGALLSLFLLAQAVFAISNPRLLNQLVETLFRPSLKRKVVRVESKDIFEMKNNDHENSELEVPEFLLYHMNENSSDATNGKDVSKLNKSNPICAAFYSYLASQDERLILGAICVLYAVSNNAAVSKDLMDVCNLSSARQRRANKLLNRLTNPSLTSRQAPSVETAEPRPRNSSVPTPVPPSSKLTLPQPDEDQEPLNGKSISAAEELSHGVLVETEKPVQMSQQFEHQKNGTVLYDYPQEIVTILLQILERHTPVRPLTQRAIAKLLVRLALDENGPSPVLKPEHLKQLEFAYTMSVDRVVAYMDVLEPEMFLHLFRQTWKSVQAGPLRVEHILNQPSHLLPLKHMKAKNNIAWQDVQELVPLEARDPVGPLEDATHAINSCIVLRLLRSSMLKEPNSKLAGLCSEQKEVKVNAKINIESCEYVKVRVVGAFSKEGSTMSEAYMVLAHDSLILVDPDKGRKGKGITRSISPLQYINIGIDHLDPRQIHLCIHSQGPIGWARREKDLPEPVKTMLGEESKQPTVVDDIKVQRWFITLLFYDHATSTWAREDLQRAIDLTRKRKLDAIRKVLVEGAR